MDSSRNLLHAINSLSSEFRNDAYLWSLEMNRYDPGSPLHSYWRWGGSELTGAAVQLEMIVDRHESDSEALKSLHSLYDLYTQFSAGVEPPAPHPILAIQELDTEAKARLIHDPVKRGQYKAEKWVLRKLKEFFKEYEE